MPALCSPGAAAAPLLRRTLALAACLLSTSEGVVRLGLAAGREGLAETGGGGGGGAALLRGRPWKTYVPPTRGCALSSCKNSRVTPRDTLRRMSPERLHKLKVELGRDVEKLEREVADSERQHSEALDELEGRRVELLNRSMEEQQGFDDERAQQLDTLNVQSETADGLLDDVGNASDSVEKEREALQSVRSSMRSTLWAAHGCDLSKCPALSGLLGKPEFLAVTSVVLESQRLSAGEAGVAALTLGEAAAAEGGRLANVPDDMVRQEELVREVEALEEKKVKLEGDQQRDLISYMAAQRAMLDRSDEFGRTERSRHVANGKEKHYLDTKGRHLRKQHGASERYVQHQVEVQARLQRRTSSLSDELEELKAAMGRCKCR